MLLSCDGLVQPLDPMFSWNIPSGYDILYSNSFDPTEQTVRYISPGLLVSTQGDGSIQSQELDYKFSIQISSGSLSINSFSTLPIMISDAITTQSGVYTCRSSRGIYRYNVIDVDATTGTTTTTTTNTSSSSNDTVTDSLSEVSIYYIVLGVFLFVALAGFIFILARTHRKKKPSSPEERLIPSVEF